MVIRYFLWLLLGLSSASATLSLHPSCDEEALFLRRIAQFYEEKEFDLVQKEIKHYLEQYSESPFWYELSGVLGDLLVNEKKYQEAIEAYKVVKDPVLKSQLACNYLLALFHNGNNEELLTYGKSVLNDNLIQNEDEKEKIYFFMGASLYDLATNEINIAKKNGFALEAKEYLEKVQKKEYLLSAKERIAHIFSLLKDDKSACTLYEELSHSYPDQKERFLFQEGLMQSSFDKKSALETFAQVCLLEGELAKEAAFNRLILLYDQEQYSDLLLVKDQMISLLEEKHLPFFTYFLGKSYFELEDYTRAAETLKTYILFQEGKGQEEKSALLLYLSAAEKLENVSLYSEGFSLFQKQFPDDPQLVKAQMVRALLFKKQHDLSSALGDFQSLEKKLISEDKDLFLYEYGRLLFDMEKWDQSYALFTSLILEFPKSSYSALSSEYLIHLSLKRKKEATKEDETFRKEQLIKDLQMVLNQNNEIPLSEEKRKEFTLLLCSSLYDLKQFDEAISLLLPCLENMANPEQKAKASLMLAYLYQEKKGDAELFCKYAEDALNLSASLEKTADVHLALFNAYLSSLESAQNTKKASDHLFRAFEIAPTLVSQENRLWLVQVLYNQITTNENNSEVQLKRALVLYPTLLSDTSGKKDFNFLETHILQFADLLTQANEIEKKIQFLESLSAQYDTCPDLHFTFQPKCYFELAKAYEQIENRDLAKKYYEKVFLSHERSSCKAEAMLHHSRIVLAEIKEEDFHASNLQIQAVLGRLKSVALQKSALTEPIHLQAALEAIDLQCACEKDNSAEKHLFLLNKLTESFTTQDDILSKQYHEALENHSDKKLCFETYMSLVEAEKAYWTAKLEKKEDMALEGFNKLKENSEKLSSYLIDRINKKIEMSQTR